MQTDAQRRQSCIGIPSLCIQLRAATLLPPFIELSCNCCAQERRGWQPTPPSVTNPL